MSGHDDVLGTPSWLPTEADAETTQRLLPLVYDELRSLARSYLRRERPDHTLQPTALVHEAFLRLDGREDGAFNDRTHFFRAAALAMRQVLVDHARRKKTSKRGDGQRNVTLDELTPGGGETDGRGTQVDLIDLDRALTRLAERAPRQCRVVELRCFTGLTLQETSEVLGLSRSTVEHDWLSGKAFLSRELSRT
ncbi:MAG: ECF-type sigma factor [Acidobacteriota bacterium]